MTEPNKEIHDEHIDNSGPGTATAHVNRRTRKKTHGLGFDSCRRCDCRSDIGGLANEAERQCRSSGSGASLHINRTN
jgi:hypothetical protein